MPTFLVVLAIAATLALFAILDALKAIKAELIRTRDTADQQHRETKQWLEFIQASVRDVEIRLPEPDHPADWSEEE